LFYEFKEMNSPSRDNAGGRPYAGPWGPAVARGLGARFPCEQKNTGKGVGTIAMVSGKVELERALATRKDQSCRFLVAQSVAWSRLEALILR